MAEADYPGSPYCAVNFYPSEVDQHGYGMHGRCEAVKKPCGAVDRGPDAEGAMTASLPIDRGGTQDPHRPTQHRTPPPPPQSSGHCVWGEGHADCSMPKTENENAAHCHESRAECEGPCAEDYASAWCAPGDTGMRRTIRYMPTTPGAHRPPSPSRTSVDLSAGCPTSAPDCAWELVNRGTGTHCPGPCITVGEAQSKLECQIAAVSKDRTIGTDAARRRPNAPCAIVWFERSHDCHLATRCTGDGLANLRQGWVLDLAGVRNEQPAHQPPPPPTAFGCPADEPGKMMILSRFVALSVSLILKVSPLQTAPGCTNPTDTARRAARAPASAWAPHPPSWSASSRVSLAKMQRAIST